ncbi:MULTISPECIES: RHS repeat-associated core domain-containing protein [unclassified Pseudoxanthomonas]|uniref:RHS repeat-associated core domain-containing protein n=1 Tax=unclassified Pseudoxanthomonas TaxID=2645906 RepID=UPI0031B87695
MYYYRARYYSPSISRFIAEDPVGLSGGDNVYSYVEGNPIIYVDPLGLWKVTLSLFKGIGGAIFFGNDEASGGFVGIRAGKGFGGGILYEPLGTAPGADPCSNGGLGIGGFAEAGLNAGPIQAALGGNLGVKFTPSDGSIIKPYGGLEPQGGVGNSWGIKGSASVGVEITLHGGRPRR